jgi:hypothetical protein
VSERKVIEIYSSAPLTDQQSEVIIAVSMALNGVRMDLQLQEIVDIVVELHNEGHAWDSVGLAILGAQKGEGVH